MGITFSKLIALLGLTTLSSSALTALATGPIDPQQANPAFQGQNWKKLVKVYEYTRPRQGQYYYSTNANLGSGWERKKEFGNFVVFPQQEQGTVPVYQHDTGQGIKFATNQAGKPGWKVAFYAFDQQVPGTAPIYAHANTAGRLVYTPLTRVRGGFQPQGVAFYSAIHGLKLPEITYKALPVKLDGQQTDLWCWAAVTEMVGEYYYQPVEQCKEANSQFGRSDCCSGSKSNKSTCRKPAWHRMGSKGLTFRQTSMGRPLTWEQIKTEINNLRPFAFSVYYKSGGGHIMLAAGYKEVQGQKFVYVLDPWPQGRGKAHWVTFEAFKATSKYKHGMDVYGVQPRG